MGEWNVLVVKIAGQALPSCEFRMWKAAIHESLGVYRYEPGIVAVSLQIATD